MVLLVTHVMDSHGLSYPIGGVYYDEASCRSGVPQGSVFGLLLPGARFTGSTVFQL